MPFYGWAVVAAGVLVTFCTGPGQSFVFSAFIDSIIAATGLSRTAVSGLYAVGTGVSAVMVVIVSRLVDRLGARIMLIVIAAALGTACFGMAGATGALTVLLGFAALRALGQGSLSVTATLLANQWFVQRRGRAVAVVGLGFALSNALLPPTARALIDHIGWRGAYMVLGVMVWTLVIPPAIFVVRNRPEDLGLYPDGASTPPQQEIGTGQDSTLGDVPRRTFGALGFWLLAVPLAAPSFITTALIFHQVSIFHERGLSASVAAEVFVPYAVASASATLIGGVLVDRIGPKRLFLINLTILLGALAMLQFVSSPLGAIVYALILGASGGIQSLISGVTWAYYYGRRGLGKVQGSAMMINISSAAIGPLPFAWLEGRTGGYGASFVMVVALLLVCWAIAALFRPTPEALGIRRA
jgi:MFS family permease